MAADAAALPAPRDALKPASADGRGIGITLSVLVHIGLLIALTLGVRWHTQAPEATQAELWAAVPRIAPPTPPVPAPQPQPEPERKEQVEEVDREAQIAIEKTEERKRQAKRAEEAAQKAAAEKAKQEKKAKEQAAAEKREAEAEAAKLAALRQQNLKRFQSQLESLGAPSPTPNPSQATGPSAEYAGRIVARVRPNIVFPTELPGNPTAEVEVQVAKDGTIVDRRLVKSSGNPGWDEAVLRAITKTGVLPRDVDGSVPPVMVIRFRPHD
jgi:colicin import membrane protein